MSKTDKVEITEDMNFDQEYCAKRQNEIVDAIENLGRLCRSKLYSEYTPNMEHGDDVYGNVTTVMLEIPTRVVKSAILISEEINAKSKEMYGVEWGITPIEVLADVFEKTDIEHNPDYVVSDEMEEVKRSEDKTHTN